MDLCGKTSARTASWVIRWSFRNLFFTAAVATMRSGHRAIHASQVVIDRSKVDFRRSQTLQNFVQSTVRLSTVERFLRTEFFGQVSPWRAGSQFPKDSIDKDSPIPLRTPRFASGGKTSKMSFHRWSVHWCRAILLPSVAKERLSHSLTKTA